MKEGNKLLGILVVLLLLVCVGMGTFIFLNVEKLTAKENEKTTIKADKKDTNSETIKCEDVNYDINTSEYGLSVSVGGISINIDKTRKSARIAYNGNKLNSSFNLGWSVVANDTYTYTTIDTKTFDKKITQVLIDGSGHTIDGALILYLMEDGTVQYVPILKDIRANWNQSDDTKKFNSYGTIEGLSEVISLIPAEADGYHTVLARKVDGTVINLSDTFNKINS